MADLRAIRHEWERLLGQKTVEADWQRFFAEHPEALALSLPLRLAPCDFHALARPGKAEPDFWFFEQRPSPIPIHGLIELKTPHAPILSSYRRGTPVLSRAAAGAIEQVTIYGKDVLPSLVSLPTSSVLFGNTAYYFVIIGLAESVAARLANDVFLNRIASLPRNVRLLGFDELLRAFHSRLPPKVLFLSADLVGTTRCEYINVWTCDPRDEYQKVTTVMYDPHGEFPHIKSRMCPTEVSEPNNCAAPPRSSETQPGRGAYGPELFKERNDLIILANDPGQWLRVSLCLRAVPPFEHRHNMYIYVSEDMIRRIRPNGSPLPSGAAEERFCLWIASFADRMPLCTGELLDYGWLPMIQGMPSASALGLESFHLAWTRPKGHFPEGYEKDLFMQ